MLSVLIVGCGNIAGGFDADHPHTETPFTHAGAYTRHGGFVLTACVEPDRNKRAAFMQRWSAATGFDTLEEARSAGIAVDVISVCSPTEAHYGHVLEALRMAPRLIFCEKPVSHSAAQTEELVQRCADAGVLLMVNHTRRWDPSVLRLAAELCAGEWGAIRSMVGVYNKGVLNNGSHMIDLLHLLLGPMALCSAGQPVDDMLPGDPSIPVVLSGPSGEPVQLACANAGDYSMFELQVITEKGVIVMEDGGLHWRIRKAVQSPTFSGYWALDEGGRTKGGIQQATLGAVRQIYQVLKNGGPLSSTGETALAAQKLCESILRHATDKVN